MPKITGARFVIAVPDLQSSAAFYRDVLGFTVHSIPDSGFLFYTSGDYTIVAGECPDAIHPSQLGDHSYFAYLQIDGIDSFYESVRTAGAQICKTIRDEAWGMREFGLVTTDGHRIMSRHLSPMKPPSPKQTMQRFLGGVSPTAFFSSATSSSFSSLGIL